MACDFQVIGLPLAFYLPGPRGMSPGLAIRDAGALALIAAQVAFFWAALVSPRAVQIVVLVLFAAIEFLQYGFVAGAGAVVNSHDVTMAFQNTKHWQSMASAFVDWRALVPVALYAGALLGRATASARWARAWAAAAGLALVVHGTYAAAYWIHQDVELGSDYTIEPPTTVFQSLVGSLTTLASDHVAAWLHVLAREDVTYHASSAPTRHVVLVIDESMSADHLSFNGYARPTTPFLESLLREGKLSNWGDAAAASTYSDASVCTLLTGFASYPDLAHRVFTLPTIFQFAKAMGYTTHLFDGEFSGRRFGLSASDARFLDDWRTTTAFGDDYDTDVRLAHAASEALAQPAGQFIVILKRGNHEPPEHNAPAAADEWRPTLRERVPADETIAAITNTYDNAVRYNLDAFFRALLAADGGLPRTVGLYTSDHAEALGDDGRAPFLRTIAHEVVTVPLFMFGDERPPVDTGYAAAHQNVFATMLDLLGVPDSARHWTYGRSLLQAHASDHDTRPVLGGFMFGPRFFFEVRDFDDLTRVLASSQGAQ